jgi:hypothetical protein
VREYYGYVEASECEIQYSMIRTTHQHLEPKREDVVQAQVTVEERDKRGLPRRLDKRQRGILVLPEFVIALYR